MQRLLVMQSLWAMEPSHTGAAELSLSGKIETVAAAGYDGIAIDCDDADFVRRASNLAKSLGLVIEGQITPRSEGALRTTLELAADCGLHHLAVQPDIRPRSLADGARILEGWQVLAAEIGVSLFIETHRGRMTNDLLFTLDLLHRIPGLPLLADVSHYVVGREMEWPVTADNDAMIRKILDKALAFHGRVASSEQVQVEITFPQNRKWLDLFLGWWDYGFRSWRQRAADNASLSFTCELGPYPYAIRDAQDRDSTDRWTEAGLMARLVRERWQKIVDTEEAMATT